MIVSYLCQNAQSIQQQGWTLLQALVCFSVCVCVYFPQDQDNLTTCWSIPIFSQLIKKVININ